MCLSPVLLRRVQLSTVLNNLLAVRIYRPVPQKSSLLLSVTSTFFFYFECPQNPSYICVFLTLPICPAKFLPATFLFGGCLSRCGAFCIMDFCYSCYTHFKTSFIAPQETEDTCPALSGCSLLGICRPKDQLTIFFFAVFQEKS